MKSAFLAQVPGVFVGLAGLGAMFISPVFAIAALEEARQMYPAVIADLERQCLSPRTLSAQAFTDSNGTEKLNILCWSEANADGMQSGTWLGNLPLGAHPEGFGEALTCGDGDEMCDQWLPVLQNQYPTALQQAEFQCAMKEGTLFTQFGDESVTVRCGFFATTVYDQDGDGMTDYEDPVSVDIPVTTLPLAE